jgi:penicillin-binding protein 1C
MAHDGAPVPRPLGAGGKRLRRFALRAGLAVLVLAVLWQWALPWCFSIPGALHEPLPPSAILTDRHGTPMKRFLSADDYRSEHIPLPHMPADLIACVLAAEDRRFYSHGGVDYLALVRAVRDAAADGRFTSGASTITQQLIKITSLPAPRNVWTKLREMQQARHLEMMWSKNRILEEYLNRVDFGGLCRGVGAAAEYYFGKPVAQLSLAECAWLAGLPQSPSRHSVREPEGTRRHDFVLERWAALHPRESVRAEAARRERLAFRNTAEVMAAGHVITATKRSRQGRDGLATGIGTVRTTIDLPLQEKCADILRAEVTQLESRNVQQGAVVVLDNATGEILALVGSADWSGKGGQINGALTPRSAGSTLKPFTYGLALERGWSPASVLEDVPSFYSGPGGAQIEVVNYDHRHRGPVPLREALACSLNIPAVRLLQALGGPGELHALLCRAGFSRLGMDAGSYGLGLTIGNAEVTLLDLTAAYAALARGGEVCRARLRSDESDSSAPSDSIFSRETCWLLADILSDPAARSAQFGTGGPLRLPFRCAVKTGTSSDFRDNWCVGFTPQFTVGVWVGNFDGTPMQGVSGASGAAPVFHRIMARLHEHDPPRWPERPAAILTARIDSRTGRLPAENAPAPWHREEFFASFPPPARPADLAADGRAVLDEQPWGAWFRSAANDRASAFVLARPVAGAPRIVSPGNETLCRLDPELPGGGASLLLQCELAPADARWSSDTLAIERNIARLIPGEHRVKLTDTRTGGSSEVTLRVVE